MNQDASRNAVLGLPYDELDLLRQELDRCFGRRDAGREVPTPEITAPGAEPGLDGSARTPGSDHGRGRREAPRPIPR